MVRVILLTPAWRLVTALLVATSLATLPTYALAIVLLPPVPPIVMARSFALGTILPAAVAWAVGRAFAATVELRDGSLQLRRADLAIDLPVAAIARLRPWWLPLPQAGLTIRLASGRRLAVGVAVEHPGSLLDLLERAGVETEHAREHPTMVYAATRRPASVRWLVGKFVGLGLLPTGVFFYTHQHIAYGGTLGQYYLEGLQPYLATFLAYWTTVVILLVSYASAWRALAEATVWAAAIGSGAAGRTRRVAEATCGAAYYAGVPILVALRYLG